MIVGFVLESPLLGLFDTNALHNIVHILSGLVLLSAFAKRGAAAGTSAAAAIQMKTITARASERSANTTSAHSARPVASRFAVPAGMIARATSAPAFSRSRVSTQRCTVPSPPHAMTVPAPAAQSGSKKSPILHLTAIRWA